MGKDNTAPGCFMSMLFETEETIEPATRKAWEGTVLWRVTKNPYRPGHKRCNWFVGVTFFDEKELPGIDGTSNMPLPAQVVKAVRMSTRWKRRFAPPINRPTYQSAQQKNVPNLKIRKGRDSGSCLNFATSMLMKRTRCVTTNGRATPPFSSVTL